MTAQAAVNVMENLFDRGEMDQAWDRLKSFEQESRDGIYDAGTLPVGITNELPGGPDSFTAE